MCERLREEIKITFQRTKMLGPCFDRCATLYDHCSPPLSIYCKKCVITFRVFILQFDIRAYPKSLNRKLTFVHTTDIYLVLGVRGVWEMVGCSRLHCSLYHSHCVGGEGV